MNLPAYPKYKDSGVAWLGMVPEGWEVKKYVDREILAGFLKTFAPVDSPLHEIAGGH